MDLFSCTRSQRKQVLKKSDDAATFSLLSMSSSSSQDAASPSSGSSSSGYQSSQELMPNKITITREMSAKQRKTRDKGQFSLPSEQQREKNNAAVRRSREKAKKHIQEVLNTISQLTEQNEQLEKSADLLRKEANLIRAMYSAHIRTGHGLTLAAHDLICPDDITAADALRMISLAKESPVKTLLK